MQFNTPEDINKIFFLQADTTDYRSLFPHLVEAGVEVRKVPQLPYYVSEYGEVIIAKQSYVRSGYRTKGTASKYLQVSLSVGKVERTVFVHRLVYLCFKGPLLHADWDVCHKDCDTKNNHISNLKYADKMVNSAHKSIHGSAKARFVMDESQARFVASLIKQGISSKKGSKLFVAQYQKRDIMRNLTVTDRFGNRLSKSVWDYAWNNLIDYAKWLMIVKKEVEDGVKATETNRIEEAARMSKREVQKAIEAATINPLFQLESA